MKQLSTQREGRGAAPLIKGLTTALTITLILLFLLAALYNNMDISSPLQRIMLAGILGLASLIGGWIASKYSGKNGLQNGMIIGGVLFLATTIPGCVLHGFAFTSITAMKAAISVGAGAVGGVIGVNMQARRKLKL